MKERLRVRAQSCAEAKWKARQLAGPGLKELGRAKRTAYNESQKQGIWDFEAEVVR